MWWWMNRSLRWRTRVTQVDPLPKGLGSGAFYEVNINFELNPEQ